MMISDLHEVPEVITLDFSAVIREFHADSRANFLGSYPSSPVYSWWSWVYY